MPAPTATATHASSGDGTLVIDEARPWPQPNPRRLALRLRGHADSLKLRVYTAAWVLSSAQDAPGGEAGWVQLDLEDSLRALPNGLYYFEVEAESGSVHSTKRRGPLLVLR